MLCTISRKSKTFDVDLGKLSHWKAAASQPDPEAGERCHDPGARVG